MIVKENGMGWIIEPVTSDQAKALEKIIEGLCELIQGYGEATGELSATSKHSNFSPAPTMGSKE